MAITLHLPYLPLPNKLNARAEGPGWGGPWFDEISWTFLWQNKGGLQEEMLIYDQAQEGSLTLCMSKGAVKGTGEGEGWLWMWNENLFLIGIRKGHLLKVKTSSYRILDPTHSHTHTNTHTHNTLTHRKTYKSLSLKTSKYQRNKNKLYQDL